MRIVNKSHYRTSDLRRLTARLAREELSPEKAELVTVTFGYRRSRPGNHSTSGFAWLGGTKCSVNLSRHGVDQVDLALTLAHEFAHLRGLVHRQMQNSQYKRTGKWREWYAWAAAYPIRGQEAPSAAEVLAQRLHYADTLHAGATGSSARRRPSSKDRLGKLATMRRGLR